MTDSLKYYYHTEDFVLESGDILSNLRIAYHSYGQLNESRSNVIWVFHALTGSSAVHEWWKGLYGEGNIFDPSEYFIICVNVLGSCYGSTCPLDKNPKTGKNYLHDFPFYTIRDEIGFMRLLKNYLSIENIFLAIGASLGGYQSMEWSIIEPELIENQILISCSAAETPWAKGLHTAHRMAIEADKTWNSGLHEGGENGLKAARAMGMMFYRTLDAFNSRHNDTDFRIRHFSVDSYLRYQGEKLADRFNAMCYYKLLECLDSHNVGRGRGGIELALSSIKSNTLIIGVHSDLLAPIQEQQFIHQHIKDSSLVELNSEYGHDAFLVETEIFKKHILGFLKSHINSNK